MFRLVAPSLLLLAFGCPFQIPAQEADETTDPSANHPNLQVDIGMAVQKKGHTSGISSIFLISKTGGLGNLKNLRK